MATITKYQFGREMAEQCLKRIIHDGYRPRGIGSLDMMPCEAIGKIIADKKTVKPAHIKAIEFMVKNAKTEIEKGIADLTKERFEQYTKEQEISDKKGNNDGQRT